LRGDDSVNTSLVKAGYWILETGNWILDTGYLLVNILEGDKFSLLGLKYQGTKN
jgi:hypothetical protein